MNDNDAGAVIAVVDKRIQRHVKSEAQVETTWGEVCGISDDGKYASAYLYGEAEVPSEGFRIPADLALNVGDKVKVAWDARGDRWVYDLSVPSDFKKVSINPNTGVIATGDGTVAPTPISDQFAGTAHEHTIVIAELPATATTDQYPVGVSTFSSTAANGWPVDLCQVTTYKFSEARIFQLVTSHNGEKMYYRVGHSSAYGVNAWSPNFIAMTPNDMARIRLSAVDDVSLTSTLHALQIGPSAGTNLAIDNNEIMARSNGAASDLNLNADGGIVTVNNNGGTGGLRVMRGGLAIGTTTAPADDLSIQIGADTALRRVASNILGMASGDRFDLPLIGRKIVKSTTQSIANSVFTRITGYTSSEFGLSAPIAFNAYGGNELRADNAGLYLIVAHATFLGAAAGSRRIISLSFANAAVPPSTPTDTQFEVTYVKASETFDIHMVAMAIKDLSANDTVAVAVNQNSGAALNITDASLTMIRLGVLF